ncbi:hypothetical protein [Curtobacterium flaccumfaciens]|uniref:hypothetical protein n=1 Tax=Curtobacterium flaccumfaciens TaxID=2035 RepID=UPI001E2EF0BB|nr:hypothetical protein [Curtobacterium allii]MCE0459514.1 hypothetical protein [Curtobacterium allii]
MANRSTGQNAARIAAGVRIGLGWKLGVPIAVVALALACLIILPVMVVATTTSQNEDGTRACSVGGVNLAGAPASVAGYSGEQLENAGAIVDAGNALGVPSYGVNIAVMTAIGESGLRVLDRGDAAGPDSRGLFQQRGNGAWGSYEDRMDPTISATNFYKALLKVPGWQQMDPSEAAHAVQINADANYYTKFWTTAQQVVSALTGGSGGGCQDASNISVSGNGQEVAASIMTATKQGKIQWLTPAYRDQVQAIADPNNWDGETFTGDCAIDTRVLQVIVVATQTFPKIGISDLNRRCTGSTPGAGVYSLHWQGKAVDFYSFDGIATTGRDDNAMKLIPKLDQISNPGAAIGQLGCTGGSPDLKTMHQLLDSCNHLHYQLGPGNEPLSVTK